MPSGGPIYDEVRGDEMSRDPILDPFFIGALAIPNRVVMTTVKLGYATKEGGVTNRHVAFYGRRAEGEVGLLTTEPLFVRTDGKELPTQMGIHQDAMVEGLTRIVREVHDKDGRIMAHLNHAGRAANPKLVGEGGLVSAWNVPCPANQGTPGLWAPKRSARSFRPSVMPLDGCGRQDSMLWRSPSAMDISFTSSSRPTPTAGKMTMGGASRTAFASGWRCCRP